MKHPMTLAQEVDEKSIRNDICKDFTEGIEENTMKTGLKIKKRRAHEEGIAARSLVEARRPKRCRTAARLAGIAWRSGA